MNSTAVDRRVEIAEDIAYTDSQVAEANAELGQAVFAEDRPKADALRQQIADLEDKRAGLAAALAAADAHVEQQQREQEREAALAAGDLEAQKKVARFNAASVVDPALAQLEAAWREYLAVHSGTMTQRRMAKHLAQALWHRAPAVAASIALFVRTGGNFARMRNYGLDLASAED